MRDDSPRMPPTPMNPSRLAILLSLAVLSGSGCATKPPADAFQPATTNALTTLKDADLRLTRLVVAGANVDTSEFPISLRFGEPGKIAGRSAVNRYFGGFQLGVQGAITWPPAGLGMTRMAGPSAAMKLEQQFSQALTGTSQLLTSPDGARFQNADASQVVEFRR